MWLQNDVSRDSDDFPIKKKIAFTWTLPIFTLVSDIEALNESIKLEGRKKSLLSSLWFSLPDSNEPVCCSGKFCVSINI